MKATDFCNFFEFSIQKTNSQFEVVDIQGVFDTRYVKKVSELVYCFGSMEDDYIWHDIEDTYGYDGQHDYENAQKWIEEKCHDLLNTDMYDVICAFASDGRTIENDVDLKG